MKTVTIRSLPQIILRNIYRHRPFSLQGDLPNVLPVVKKHFISCLIPAGRRPEVLEQLLADMARQTLNRERFEVMVLDNYPSGVEQAVQKYADLLPLTYLRDTSTFNVGRLRNHLLAKAQGEYVLSLDDDTRIAHKDFLATCLQLCRELQPDIIVALGKGLADSHRPDYTFLNPYSLGACCCVYKRSALEEVGGFRNDITAYEDIELGIRLYLRGAKVLRTDALQYEHPPFFFDSFKKPFAIGQSIYKLRDYYPWYIWLIIYINALRFLPRILFPTVINRQWIKISLGVLYAPFLRKEFSYKIES